MNAAPKPTVLVVDDTPANLTLMAHVLRPHYRVLVAVTGAKALEIAVTSAPEVIVLDVMMPELDGYEVCRRLKQDPATRGIPVIFLTALTSVEDETAAFQAGAADFVTKPFHAVTLLARVRTQFELKQAQDRMHRRNTELSREVEALRDTTLFVMIGLAEFRDTDTGYHIVRTQEYVRALGTWLARQPGAPPELTEDTIDQIAKAAPLHDIGKVSIPDAILLKPGKLSAEEWVVMKTHSAAGADLLQRAIDRLGSDAGSLLSHGKQIARHHHEKWDGSGYPDGLAGEAIPLSARLMAVADVYDALLSRRPYKEPMSHAAAMSYIQQGAGGHFDPGVVAALTACEERFKAIAEEWCD